MLICRCGHKFVSGTNATVLVLTTKDGKVGFDMRLICPNCSAGIHAVASDILLDYSQVVFQ